MSTHTTVRTAALLFTFVSKSMSGDGDATRIAAQIVSGIGFLGAGIIMKSESNNTVSNLTTAACIWYCAAIGVVAWGFKW